MIEKYIKKKGTQTIILNPEWIKKNYPDTFEMIQCPDKECQFNIEGVYTPTKEEEDYVLICPFCGKELKNEKT